MAGYINIGDGGKNLSDIMLNVSREKIMAKKSESGCGCFSVIFWVIVAGIIIAIISNL